MILETKEDFENAILKGETINSTTIFWTDDRPNFDLLKLSPVAFASDGLEIGAYNPKYGIYAGMCNRKQIWVALKDAPEEKNWQDAVDYCDGNTHLPTKEELILIYVNKDIINKALTEAGGEPLKEDWYWSSSEYGNDYAWSQRFSDGYIYYYGIKSSNGYVRPVLALSI